MPMTIDAMASPRRARRAIGVGPIPSGSTYCCPPTATSPVHDTPLNQRYSYRPVGSRCQPILSS